MSWFLYEYLAKHDPEQLANQPVPEFEGPIPEPPVKVPQSIINQINETERPSGSSNKGRKGSGPPHATFPISTKPPDE